MGILQVFTLLGALGMFLYGMNLMSSGLQKAAGERLRGFLSAMTPIACVNVRRPALTKLTTITVVAEEDWIIDVIPTPVNTPFKGLDVIADKNPLNLSPAAF